MHYGIIVQQIIKIVVLLNIFFSIKIQVDISYTDFILLYYFFIVIIAGNIQYIK